MFKKVNYGESESHVGKKLYGRRRAAGVRKSHDSDSPHPEKYPAENNRVVIEARKDIDFLAKEFINKLFD